MKPWRTVSRRILLYDSRYLTVEQHTIELPDGQVIDDWAWVITPEYVNVAATTEDGRYLCFRQTKYAVEGVSLAPAGGYIEPGEEPLTAAQRELLEETGFEAPEWHNLGSYAVDGNRGAGTCHLFLARGARRVAEAAADDLEEQELLFLTAAEVRAALARAEFKVLPWAALMSLALGHTE